MDFVALKRLIIQLFLLSRRGSFETAMNSQELILSQPLYVGTTVKTDGKESDPYAFLTVLNMHVHKDPRFIFSSVNEHLKAVLLQDNPSIKAIAEYILLKSAGDPSLHNTLKAILSHDAPSHLGFIFTVTPCKYADRSHPRHVPHAR